jgi:hypothetical protein
LAGGKCVYEHRAGFTKSKQLNLAWCIDEYIIRPEAINYFRYLLELQGRNVGAGNLCAVRSESLLLHYLLTADGTPPADRWIAFRNLAGGLGYDAAFQGRANLRLARAFGTDRPAFEAAARALGGERLSFGDASFSFRLLPRVWLAVVLNLADDEFTANANVLFDGMASHYLPTEDLAVLGGMLAGRLIKAA